MGMRNNNSSTFGGMTALMYIGDNYSLYYNDYDDLRTTLIAP
jgi:hypothetical protein